MQSGHCHSRPAHKHRFQNCKRGHAARAPNRDLDVGEHRRAFLWRELEGNRPSGSTGGGAQHLPLSEIVDLNHHPVNFISEVVAMMLPMLTVSDHCIEIFEDPHLRIDRKSQSRQKFQAVMMGCDDRPSLHLTHLIGPHLKSACGCYPMILLTQAACGSVTWIHKTMFTGLCCCRVEILKGSDRQVHLASNLKNRRHRTSRVRRLQMSRDT